MIKKYERALVMEFQRNNPPLAVDGIFGPNTRSALNDVIGAQKVGVLPSRIEQAWRVAHSFVGITEEPPGSNRGEDIDLWRDEVDLPQRGGGEWCALLQSVALTRSGVPVAHRGARGLVRMVLARVGGARRVVDTDELDDGFVGLSLHSRSGGHHIRIFRIYAVDGDLMVHAIGGNENHAVRETREGLSEYLSNTLEIVTITR